MEANKIRHYLTVRHGVGNVRRVIKGAGTVTWQTRKGPKEKWENYKTEYDITGEVREYEDYMRSIQKG